LQYSTKVKWKEETARESERGREREEEREIEEERERERERERRKESERESEGGREKEKLLFTQLEKQKYLHNIRAMSQTRMRHGTYQ